MADLRYRYITYYYNHLLVPSFNSSILSLIWCFILIHVIMKSLAPNFTNTIASSENPRFITSALLQRLVLKELQLLRLKSDGSSLGKIAPFFSLPTFNITTNYDENIGLRWSRASCRFTKIHFCLGSQLGQGFLQIPHWLPITMLPSSGSY